MLCHITCEYDFVLTDTHRFQNNKVKFGTHTFGKEVHSEYARDQW